MATTVLMCMIPVLLTQCTASNTSYTAHTQTANYNTDPMQGESNAVMRILQQNSTRKLVEMEQATVDEYHDAWYKLALIAKRDNRSTHHFSSDLIAWQDKHPGHPGNKLLPPQQKLQQLLNWRAPKKIAVLLPEHGEYSNLALKLRKGIMNAYYSNLSRAGLQNIKFYDTAQANILNVYQTALNDGADYIIGPLVKDNVKKLRELSRFPVPTLALNYASTNNFVLPANFYQFGLLPEDEARQMAINARNTGKAKALILAPHSQWGSRMVTAFTKEWETIGGNVQDAWYYTPETNFRKELATLLKINNAAKKHRNDFDVILLFASPAKARTIVPLLRYYYVSNTPIFAASSIIGQQLDPARDADYNGLQVCHLPSITKSHRYNSHLSNDKLYSLGNDAYLLSQSMARLQSLPNFPLYGSTGALMLSDKQQIHRRLPCHVIQNGHFQSA